MSEKPHVVCFGGGTGLSNLLVGLKKYPCKLTAIVTMCDSGGSTGRLRRGLGAPAVGDIRRCLWALSKADRTVANLLEYRFNGDRYDSDDLSISGQSLGNFLIIAASKITGNLNSGLILVSDLFKVSERVLPSTLEDVQLLATTKDGVEVKGEENIDLGHYGGSRTIKKLRIDPPNASAFEGALDAISQADFIVIGPGDLYTSLMPNFLIKGIRDAVQKSKARKLLIVNIANKPFETPHYKLSDYLIAFRSHFGFFPFKYVLTNNNYKYKIPNYLYYQYVSIDQPTVEKLGLKLIKTDLALDSYPIHHDSDKLAKEICSVLKLPSL